MGGRVWRALAVLGPGLVTGASDDDPSGIATYSQVGAQFGYGMLWTMVLSYPLMAAIQEISARVGRVTGCGISANLRRCYPPWLLRSVVGLVLVANIFNLGADIGAMGAAAQLLLPARPWIYILFFGIASLLLQILVPYSSYVKYLKWLTLSLFSKPKADLSQSSPETSRLLRLSAYYLRMPQRGNQRHPSDDVAEQGGKEELRDISRPWNGFRGYYEQGSCGAGNKVIEPSQPYEVRKNYGF